MIEYEIEIEGNFITFVGKVGGIKDGYKKSYRISLIKEILISNTSDYLTLLNTDNYSDTLKYTEIEDPSTPGVAFTSLEVFRSYMVNNI